MAPKETPLYLGFGLKKAVSPNCFLPSVGPECTRFLLSPFKKIQPIKHDDQQTLLYSFKVVRRRCWGEQKVKMVYVYNMFPFFSSGVPVTSGAKWKCRGGPLVPPYLQRPEYQENTTKSKTRNRCFPERQLTLDGFKRESFCCSSSKALKTYK